ncbi:hypothetical protein Dimus_030447, partial [Dionaea muscipula]
MGIGTKSRREKALIFVTSQYLTHSPLLPEVKGVDEVHFEVELVHFIQDRGILTLQNRYDRLSRWSIDDEAVLRVLRLSGLYHLKDCPPSDPFQPKEVYRGPETSKYKCQHDKMHQLWDAWHNHLITPIAMGSRRACYATEVDDDYME